MTASTMDASIDLRHYAGILWRRKGLVALAVITVFCTALIALGLMPNEYEAKVTLQFAEHQGLIRDLDQLAGPSSGSRGSTGEIEQARLRGLVARIRSQPFLEAVARQLGMLDDPSVRQAAVEMSRKQQGVSPDEMAARIVVGRLQAQIRFASVGTGIYDVIVTDYKPERARSLAEWIGRLFVEDSDRLAQRQVEAARRFAESQVASRDEDFRQAEAALARVRGDRIGEKLSGNVLRTENLGQAEVLHRRIKQDAADASQLARSFGRSLAETEFRDSDVGALREESRIREVVKSVETALARSIEDRLAVSLAPGSGGEMLSWPPHGQYLELRGELQKRLETRAGELYPEAPWKDRNTLVYAVIHEVDAKLNEDAARNLDARIQGVRHMASAEPADERELQRLEADLLKEQQILEMFRNQVMTSTVQQALESARLGTQIQILDPAQLPLAPSRPNRMKILLAALLMGPLLGAGVAFLSETMDPTLRSLEDIQRVVPDPVLCATPLLSKLKPRRGLRRHWVPITASAVVLLTGVFFLLRGTVLDDFVGVGRSTQVIAPDQSGAQTAP